MSGQTIIFIYSYGIAPRLLLIKTRLVCNELSFLANKPFTTPPLSQRRNKHNLQHTR